MVVRTLEPGRHKVKVAAINAAGTGRASEIKYFRVRGGS